MTAICTPAPALGEPTDHYGRRLLAYALSYGITVLDTEQRRLCDAAAQATVCSLPRVLEPHQAKLVQGLNVLRHQLAQAEQQRQDALRRFAQLAQALDPDLDADLLNDAPGPQAPEMTNAERLARLMAAVVRLAQQPPDDPSGGQKARLQPPRPNLPPSGQANPIPVTGPAAIPARYTAISPALGARKGANVDF